MENEPMHPDDLEREIHEELKRKLSLQIEHELTGVAMPEENEPLPPEALERALDITGVRVTKAPLHHLKVGMDFMHEGFLYTVMEKGSAFIECKAQEGDKILEFYDPRTVPAGKPAWTEEVLTDAKNVE